jgi:hypothetical protein
VVGTDAFGAPAPLQQPLVKFGFTPGQAAELAGDRMAAARQQ